MWSCDMKKLTILIINFNGSKDALELLESLKNSSFNDFDILVFDNNSRRDEDFEKLERYQGIRLIKNKENDGFTGGGNKTLKHI